MFDSEVRRQCRTIEHTLEDFSIKSRVIGITRGSSVTHFELRLVPGIPESHIRNLAKSLGVAVLEVLTMSLVHVGDFCSVTEQD